MHETNFGSTVILVEEDDGATSDNMSEDREGAITDNGSEGEAGTSVNTSDRDATSVNTSDRDADIESADDTLSCDLADGVTCERRTKEKSPAKKKSLRRTVSAKSTHSISVDNVSDRDLAWLQGDHFLERLEHEEDLDPDVLQKEVNTLHKGDKKTCRKRMVSFLTNTPFRILVLLIAFLDAVAVVSSVILEVQGNQKESDFLECQRGHLVRLFVEMKLPALQVLNHNSTIYDLIEVLEANIHRKDSFKHRKEGQIPTGTMAPSNHSEDPHHGRRLTAFHSDDHVLEPEDEAVLHPPSLKTCKKTDMSSHELLHMAHLLHYTGVALLSFLLLEVLLKIIAMGMEFFQHKFEIVDAFVITISFILDIIFLNENDKSIPVAIFLFIWQMIRVVSAVIGQDKKRIEFLMHVMKENNKTMNQKTVKLKKNIKYRKKQLASLQNLCRNLGASDEKIKEAMMRHMPSVVSSRKISAASLAKSVLTVSWEALNTIKKKARSLSGSESLASNLGRPRTKSRGPSICDGVPLEPDCSNNIRHRKISKDNYSSRTDFASDAESFSERGIGVGQESSVDSGSYRGFDSQRSTPFPSPSPSRGTTAIRGFVNMGYEKCEIDSEDVILEVFDTAPPGDLFMDGAPPGEKTVHAPPSGDTFVDRTPPGCNEYLDMPPSGVMFVRTAPPCGGSEVKDLETVSEDLFDVACDVPSIVVENGDHCTKL